MTKEELREAMLLLGETASTVAAKVGRSPTAIYYMLSGKVPVQRYVEVFINNELERLIEQENKEDEAAYKIVADLAEFPYHSKLKILIMVEAEIVHARKEKENAAV